MSLPYPSFSLTATATTKFYTLSLHDALPIFVASDRNSDQIRISVGVDQRDDRNVQLVRLIDRNALDRKSTRLNSSHPSISYAVFCLKKKIRADNRRGRVQ